MQPASMEAMTTRPKRLRGHVPMKYKRRNGSLEAAVVQCLALGVMSTAAAYPSWVIVKADSHHFVLGTVWVINHSDPSSVCPYVGTVGLALLNLTVLCCLFAILCSCGATLLDFLGLKVGRVTAPLLHGFVTLFAAIAMVTNFGIWALTKYNLHAAQDTQYSNHSSVFGSSFYFCILACILAAIATGLSCTAFAQAKHSVALGVASTRQQQTNVPPMRKQASSSSMQCFETGLPIAACVAFFQALAKPQVEEGLPFKQEGAETQAEEGVHSTHKEDDHQIEEGLSPTQIQQVQMSESPCPTKEN